jgi:hypothetical protein
VGGIVTIYFNIRFAILYTNQNNIRPNKKSKKIKNAFSYLILSSEFLENNDLKTPYPIILIIPGCIAINIKIIATVDAAVIDIFLLSIQFRLGLLFHNSFSNNLHKSSGNFKIYQNVNIILPIIYKVKRRVGNTKKPSLKKTFLELFIKNKPI